jgi:hypothetical protein
MKHQQKLETYLVFFGGRREKWKKKWSSVINRSFLNDMAIHKGREHGSKQSDTTKAYFLPAGNTAHVVQNT